MDSRQVTEGEESVERPTPNPQDRPNSREEQVSLIDLVYVLVQNRILILKTIILFTLGGVVYALAAPEQFTSGAKVVREAGGKTPEIPQGLSALGGSFGISLGGASSGLGTEAFPDVLHSREVKLSVVRDTFDFPEMGRATYVDYANRPPGLGKVLLQYTIKLPWTLKKALLENGKPQVSSSTPGITEITDDEQDALEKISDQVRTMINDETGLMSISVQASGPKLAAAMTQSFIQHLTTRVRVIRTEKVRERLQFVSDRFQEAEEELQTAEERLAAFLERNQNPTTATLQFQRDRLQRQVQFKEQLYSELQSQLTQTQLSLQQQQPVVTVMEKPAPPLKKSAPRRSVIVVVCCLLGGFLGVILAFGRKFWQNHGQDPEERKKLATIREALSFKGMFSPSLLHGDSETR